MKNKLMRLLGVEVKSLRIFERVLLLAPILLWFAYWPVIRIGSNATMNFELSLALIYCVVLALTGLPLIWRSRDVLARSPIALSSGVFILWSAATTIWSDNPLRGVLSVGIAGVLWLVMLAVLADRKRVQKLTPALTKLLLLATMIICAFELVQFVGGIWLSRREPLLLCLGCSAVQFGFVRPNVFAIEPQFLGNMLLLPTLILTRRLIIKRWSRQNVLMFMAALSGLFLTMSRGAIYAFVIGAIVLAIVYHKQWRRLLSGIGLTVAVFVIALVMQGFAAALNPHLTESFGGAIAKVVSQLSLGVINLDKPSKSNVNNDANVPGRATVKASNEAKPRYDGYVAESTDVRTNFSKVALSVWRSNPRNMLIGVGVGGAGVAMARYEHSDWSKEIVQNEFVEVLMERGVIGLGLLLLLIGIIVYVLWRSHNVWALAILIAYLVQYCFFSGLPNALHVYVAVAVLLGTLTSNHLQKRLK